MHTGAIFALAALPATLKAASLLWSYRRRTSPLASALARWFLIAYACGAFAIVPSLLRRAGIAEAVCDGNWMLIFFGYPLLRKVTFGGTLLGAAGLASLFALHYAILLLAIRRSSSAFMKTTHLPHPRKVRQF